MSGGCQGPLSISCVAFASSRRLPLPLYAAESSQETHLIHLKLRTTMSTYIHIGRLSSYSLRFHSCEPIDISGRLFSVHSVEVRPLRILRPLERHSAYPPVIRACIRGGMSANQSYRPRSQQKAENSCGRPQQHRRHDTHSSWNVASSTALAYGAAVVTLLSALMLGHSVSAADGKAFTLLALLAGIGAASLAAWWIKSRNSSPTPSTSTGLTKSLLAQLTPVVCLSIAYPAVGHRLEEGRVGAVPLNMLVLAGSLITPWLSQTVCSPLYKALSSPSPVDQPVALHSRWLAAWPFAAGTALLIAGLFGFAVATQLRWDYQAASALAVLCALNALLSQSMVVAILQRNYLSWAAAWTAYAVALVIMPSWWFLPPIAGIFTQLVYLATRRPALLRPTFNRTIIADLVKGFLIGAVLWSDKLFFFLKEPFNFHPLLVFLSILPAIVAYGYYFVRQAPGLDQLVAEMRTAMEVDPLSRSAPRLGELAGQAELTVVKATCTASVLCFAGVVIESIFMPGTSMFYAAMAVASTNFLVITIFLYKLEYIGRGDLVYWFAGAHFLLVSLVFSIASPGVVTYLTLSALSSIITLLAARSVLRAWRAPEYSFFWRYATSW